MLNWEREFIKLRCSKCSIGQSDFQLSLNPLQGKPVPCIRRIEDCLLAQLSLSLCHSVDLAYGSMPKQQNMIYLGGDAQLKMNWMHNMGRAEPWLPISGRLTKEPNHEPAPLPRDLSMKKIFRQWGSSHPPKRGTKELIHTKGLATKQRN